MHPLKGGNQNLRPHFDNDISNMVPITGIDHLLLEKEKWRQQIEELLADPAKYQKGKIS